MNAKYYVSLWIDAREYRQLLALQKSLALTRSATVRQAITDFASRHGFPALDVLNFPTEKARPPQLDQKNENNQSIPKQPNMPG